MTFGIKVVSEQTGVSVHVLRQWERRYGIPSPNRADNRYRLYDESDIADVLAIRRQIESGVSPALASAWLRQQHQVRTRAVSDSSSQTLGAHQIALETAFLGSDEPAAREILDQVFAIFSLEQVATQIIQPTMETLGTKWVQGELSVAQEHLASNLVRQKLITLIQDQGNISLPGLHFIAASAPEEEHELGLLNFVLLARHQGWRVTYLGQRTPLEEMARHAHDHKAGVIVVSITTVLGLASIIPWFAKTSRPNPPVVFGGHVLNTIPLLRDHLPGVFLDQDIVTSLKRLTITHWPRKLWAPHKKSLKAAMRLREFRFKIASETVNQLGDDPPVWGPSSETLAHPTLLLIDALACAIAFEVPELMDAQREWLRQALLPRSIQPQMLNKHLQVFKRTVKKNLGEDIVQDMDDLIERLQG